MPAKVVALPVVHPEDLERAIDLLMPYRDLITDFARSTGPGAIMVLKLSQDMPVILNDRAAMFAVEMLKDVFAVIDAIDAEAENLVAASGLFGRACLLILTSTKEDFSRRVRNGSGFTKEAVFVAAEIPVNSSTASFKNASFTKRLDQLNSEHLSPTLE